MTARILVGDATEQLRALPAGSVHCVVTSPPYYGLRDYGIAGQIGLEESPGAYLERMVAVFREIARVLRDDGTCWVNMGDSYAGGGNTGGKWREGSARADGEVRGDGATSRRNRNGNGAIAGLKPKDLMGMPWRLAFALQADGWWLRQEIIWAKPNPMPESVRDRCTKAHEYLFLLAKSERYYFDQLAIAEACSPETHPRLARNATATGSLRANGGTRPDRPMKALGPRGTTGVGWGYDKGEPRVKDAEVSARMGRAPGWRKAAGWSTEPGGHHGTPRGRYTPKQNASFEAATSAEVVGRRNKRSVWEIGSEPYRGAHFATYPTKLVEPCILAGTSAHGCCSACGAPWRRQVARTKGTEIEAPKLSRLAETGKSTNGTKGSTLGIGGAGNGGAWAEHGTKTKTLGWGPSCTCGAPDGVRKGDNDIIESPIASEFEAEDPSLEVGRAGMARPRGADEGVTSMTRYEQRQYAAALRKAEHRAEMIEQVGLEAWRHYRRTDRAGARAIPAGLLEEWIAKGWLARAQPLPKWEPRPVLPCTVLDPFGGAGTTALVAERLHRHSILIELNPKYAGLAARRIRAEAPLLADVHHEEEPDGPRA